MIPLPIYTTRVIFNTDESVTSKNISGDSSLCWAFAVASMLHRSLIYFYNQYKNDDDLHLTEEEKKDIEDWLINEDKKFVSILRQQITMNPIPKRIKKGETAIQRHSHENESLQKCFYRVSY